MIDITGEKFGRLTAVREGPRYIFKNGQRSKEQWWCKCECGREVLVTKSNLRSGNTKSCGCWKRDRMIYVRKPVKINISPGTRFGRLVVVEQIDDRRNGHILWKCQCDCGRYTIVYANSLRSGSTSSCGRHRNTSIK